MKITSYTLLMATANHLARNYFNKFFHTFLTPIDYTRTKEIPTLLSLSGILMRRDEKIRILDVGSPQLLSLALCRYSPHWEVTYINLHKPELEDIQQKASILCLNNLHIFKADIVDANTVSYLGTFDYIFSCSVFEHIHPENGGDTLAAENVFNLLNASGVFAFSVPYYKIKFNEYRFGDVYAMQGNPNSKIFFQRFYDEESLHEQIITPTGLKVAKKVYIGERFYSSKDIRRRMAFLVGFGKRALILGRLFNIISNVFMEKSQDYKDLKKPYLAFYKLEKDVSICA